VLPLICSIQNYGNKGIVGSLYMHFSLCHGVKLCTWKSALSTDEGLFKDGHRNTCTHTFNETRNGV